MRRFFNKTIDRVLGRTRVGNGEHAPKAPNSDEEPFPTRLAFGVWLVQFYNGIQYAEIFTLAAYIVRRLEGPGASEKKIGQMAGLLAGASSLAMGIGAWPWGRFSNRIGRKPIILFGNCWTASCIVLFCSAKVYWVALLARFLAGILDGSVVMTKIMVGESCRPKMQGKIMSYLSLGDAMGNIIGPVMGGLLADPCERFLKGSAVCSPGSQLTQRPYLLAGLVTACLGFSTTILNIAFMDETLPSKKPDRRKGYGRLEETQVPAEFEESRNSLLRLETDEDTSLNRPTGKSQKLQDPPAKRLEGRNGNKSWTKPLLRQQEPEVEMQFQQSRVGRDGTATEEELIDDTSHIGTQDRETEALLSNKVRDRHNLVAAKSPWDSLDKDVEKQAISDDPIDEEKWYRNRPLLLSILVCAIMLSLAKYNDELGPIFVSAPVSQGGLNISLSTFSLPLSCAGLMVTFFALFGYPALQTWAGLKLTCSIGLLLAIPGALILPTAYFWMSTPFLKMATIYVALTITKLATQTSFTSSMVIINSVGPRSQLGDVNGVRMMMAALGRASGPLIGGYLWGVSATLTVPGHQFLGFALSSVGLIACFLLHNSIPLHIPD